MRLTTPLARALVGGLAAAGCAPGRTARPADAGVAGAAPPAGAPGAVATRLEVRIKRRSDGTVFWEGRSLMNTTGGASATDRAAIVQNLARAMFQDFPGESGRTISTR